MNQMRWLVGKRFRVVTKRDHDWFFELDDETNLAVSCLWRLVTEGRICVTSQDDGHQFGLPSPLVAANELNSKLADGIVDAVNFNAGTLDLAIHFDAGRTLEIIPDSSGYESWIVYGAESQFIAVGGGDLTVVPDARKT